MPDSAAPEGSSPRSGFGVVAVSSGDLVILLKNYAALQYDYFAFIKEYFQDYIQYCLWQSLESAPIIQRPGQLRFDPIMTTHDIPDLAVVICRGPDTRNFLHGQLSNDINGLSTGDHCRNAYCNPKGRVIACIDVIDLGKDCFWLLIPQDLVQAVSRRLKMFVLRAKVSVEIQDALYVSHHQTDDPPTRGHSYRADNGDLIINVGVTRDRCLRISEEPGGLDQTWIQNEIADGVPQVYDATSEAFLPQAINLDLINGVSFTKGCYPGQEIVARLKYLGKLKQRMMVFEASGEMDAQPGDTISIDGSKAGTIVTLSRLDSATTGLAVVNIAKRQGPDATMGDHPIVLSEPQYAVPEFEEQD